jgi:MSHA pilin protein MshC
MGPATAVAAPSAMHRQRGFTLAELVIVMVLVGVLAVVAIPRLFQKSEFAARGARDHVASGLRYAQKSAVAMRRNVCVAVGATSLAMTYASAAGRTQPCAAGNTIANPATGQPFDSTSYEDATVATPTTVVFDALGRPSAAASISVNLHATPITIEAETGLVR